MSHDKLSQHTDQYISIDEMCFILNFSSFNWKLFVKGLTCFSASHTEISGVEFLYSFVVWCVTVALVHNNKPQSLLVLHCSPLRTQRFWKCLWWWKTGLEIFGQILCQFRYQCVRSIPVQPSQSNSFHFTGQSDCTSSSTDHWLRGGEGLALNGWKRHRV